MNGIITEEDETMERTAPPRPDPDPEWAMHIRMHQEANRSRDRRRAHAEREQALEAARLTPLGQVLTALRGRP